MRVAVFDTYVKKSNGSLAHFDIIVPNGKHTIEEILAFGREYLDTINEGRAQLSTEECRFCHIEQPTPEIAQSINAKGYYILEMADIPASR